MTLRWPALRLPLSPILAFAQAPYFSDRTFSYQILREGQQSLSPERRYQHYLGTILYSFGQGKAGQKYVLAPEILSTKPRELLREIDGLDITLGYPPPLLHLRGSIRRQLSVEEVRSASLSRHGAVSGKTLQLEPMMPVFVARLPRSRQRTIRTVEGKTAPGPAHIQSWFINGRRTHAGVLRLLPSES